MGGVVGWAVSLKVGTSEGVLDGMVVGLMVGSCVGLLDGVEVGLLEGDTVDSVLRLLCGCPVGA